MQWLGHTFNELSQTHLGWHLVIGSFPKLSGDLSMQPNVENHFSTCLLLKLWSIDKQLGIILKFVRNAESWALSQTYRTGQSPGRRQKPWQLLKH